MRKFFVVDDKFRKDPNSTIVLPRRATPGSAGYDFYLTRDVLLKPKEEVLIWTDIKVAMENYLVFEMVMRSSYGIKKSIMMKNLTPKIDQDYFGNETNDGNIGICLYNYGDTEQLLPKGEAFCQGSFYKYYITDDDCPLTDKRLGGIGSTSK